MHEKIANQRYDYIQQHTTALVSDNQVTSFAIEDLHIKGMLNNRNLSRAIGDSGWGIFVRCLSYKSAWAGKHVLKIGRFVASAKTCHVCDRKQKKLPFSTREWVCSCGTKHDRDINAACVIRNKALADALGQSVCVKGSSRAIPFSGGVESQRITSIELSGRKKLHYNL